MPTIAEQITGQQAEQQQQVQQHQEEPVAAGMRRGREYQQITKEPLNTRTTTTKVGGFTNPDGTRNKAAEADFQQNYVEPLARAYGVNPATGIAGAFGISQEEKDMLMKANEQDENKIRENRLYQVLSILGNTITAAHGADVPLYAKNTVTEDANTRINARDNMIAAQEQLAFQDQMKREQEYGKAISDARTKYSAANGIKVSDVDKSGGEVTKEGYRDVNIPVRSSKTSGGSGSRKQKEIYVKPVGSADGVAFNVAPERATTYISKVKGYLNNKLDEAVPVDIQDYVGQTWKQLLIERGALVSKETTSVSESETGKGRKKSKTNRESTNKKGQYDWNDDGILALGIVWSDPELQTLLVKSLAHSMEVSEAEARRQLGLAPVQQSQSRGRVTGGQNQNRSTSSRGAR